MIFKKKESAPEKEAEKTPQKLAGGYTPPKGAPTPKRKDVEARNRRPIVADRRKMSRSEKKAWKQENRRKNDEIYQRQQQAMRSGDETHMPPQHKGKIRRWGRDFVDASAPISAMFMPIAILLMLPLMFLQVRLPQISRYSVPLLYALFILMGVHSFVVAKLAKLLAGYHFGFANVPRGYLMQMFGRGFYFRRWRLPSPQVKRGEFPEGVSWSEIKAAYRAQRAYKKKK